MNRICKNLTNDPDWIVSENNIYISISFSAIFISTIIFATFICGKYVFKSLKNKTISLFYVLSILILCLRTAQIVLFMWLSILDYTM